MKPKYHISDFIDEIFLVKEVYSKKNETIPLDNNVTQSEAMLLYDVVRKVKPKRSVEIGFGQGISTLAILQAIKENSTGFHYVIDPYQHEYQFSGPAMLKKAGLENNYEFKEEFPENVLPNLEPVDFVFIDASHLFDLSMLDFIYANRILNVDGILGFHDLDMKAINKLITYILRNHDYEILKDINNFPVYSNKFKAELLESPRNFVRTIYYELKKPIRFWGIGNLVFLKKTGEKGEAYRGLRDF